MVVRLFTLLAPLLAMGCVETASAPSTGVSEPIEVSDVHILEILSRSDAVDGTVDKIVSNCLMCALAMPGSPELVTQIGGYQVRHCGEGCKRGFEKNPVEYLGQQRHVPGANPVESAR